MDEFVNLAKQAIKYYLKTDKFFIVPDNLSSELLARKAGVFVSIHQKNGDLRGCIGTFLPTQKNIAQEIIQNAVCAATQDPRFPPVTINELPNLIYSVDILSTPQDAKREEIDPQKYGLIVATTDGRRGLLLPDLEGVDTPEQQIEICKMKAGISSRESVSFQIFTVKRHHQ